MAYFQQSAKISSRQNFRPYGIFPFYKSNEATDEDELLVNAVCIDLGSLTKNKHMYDVYAVVTCLLLLLSKKDKRWLLCPYSGKQTAIPKRMMEHVVYYSTLHAKAEQAE